MRKLVAARPRISDRIWLLVILPALWLAVLAYGHATDDAQDETPITVKAERNPE